MKPEDKAAIKSASLSAYKMGKAARRDALSKQKQKSGSSDEPDLFI